MSKARKKTTSSTRTAEEDARLDEIIKNIGVRKEREPYQWAVDMSNEWFRKNKHKV